MNHQRDDVGALCYDPRTQIVMRNRHTLGLFLLTLALGMGSQSRRPGSVGTTPAAKAATPKIRFVAVAAQSGLRLQHVSGRPDNKYLPQTLTRAPPRLHHHPAGRPHLSCRTSAP